MDNDDAALLGVFDASPDALLIVDATGTIRRANSLAERLFGYDPGTLTGESVDTLVPDDLRRAHVEHREKFIAHPKPRPMADGVDLRAKRPDGSTFVAQISLSSLPSTNGDLFIAAIRDVTGRRTMESRFRGLLDAALDAILIVGADGSIVLVNGEAERLFGYEKDELIGQPIGLLVPPALRARHVALRQGFQQNPSPRPMAGQLELSAARKDGALFPVEVSLNPMQGPEGTLVITAVRDVSARRTADEALRESQQRLSTILDSIGDAVIATDLDGKIVGMNPVAEALTGWAAIDTRGTSLDEVLQLIDPRNGEPIPSPLARVLDGSEDLFHAESLMIGRNGVERYVADTSAPLRGPTGDVEGVVTVLRDITERRRLEQQVELSARMASLGRLAGAVAHEINNPLTYVVSNLDFVAEELKPNSSDSPPPLDEMQEALVEAREGAERVRRIVKDLRSYSLGDVETTEPIDMAHVLEAASKLAKNEVRSVAKLSMDLPDVPPVQATGSRLEQVFLNLLVNAAAAFEGRESPDNEIRIELKFDGIDKIIASVTDNGVGLPEAVAKRVFQPFVNAKHVDTGTGLGLAICLNIIERYHGTIEVDSTLGEGTTFRVVLPASERVERPSRTYEPSNPPRKGRILIIDDEPLVADAVRRVLAPWHLVEVTTDGHDALELIRAGHEFDLIVCDVMMPSMAADRVHAEVVSLAPHLARTMIFVSGGAFAPDQDEFLRDSENICLEKPIDRAELLAAVDAALGQHHGD